METTTDLEVETTTDLEVETKTNQEVDVDTGPAGEHKTAAHLDRHGETTLTEMTGRAWSIWTEATMPKTNSRICGLSRVPAEPHSQVPAAPHA